MGSEKPGKPPAPSPKPPTANTLHETRQIAKLTSEIATPSIQKISQAAERSILQRGVDKADRVLTKLDLPEGHIWQNASPFKNRSAKELHDMFIEKGSGPRPPHQL